MTSKIRNAAGCLLVQVLLCVCAYASPTEQPLAATGTTAATPSQHGSMPVIPAENSKSAPANNRPSAVQPNAVAAPVSPWNSLEITKLVVSSLTPVAVAILGIYLTRIAKRFEHLQWRNQRLIEKRITVYDALAPQFNDLLCYFTFVGCWKDLTPPQVVAMKREMDKQIYLAAPLFPAEFFDTSMNFMNLCFATFQGWGRDARLKTPTERRKQAAAAKWDAAWDDCFTREISGPKEIRAAYQRVMSVFAREIGLTSEQPVGRLGKYPSNIQPQKAG